MRRINELLKGAKIRTKIIALYCGVLIISFLFILIIFYHMNQRNMRQEIGDAGMQTMNAVKGNLQIIFDNVNQVSDMIYRDETVQDALQNVKANYVSAGAQQIIQKSLGNMILSGDYIESVYIFDRYSNYYHSYKQGPIIVNKEKIKTSNWYERLMEARGNSFFIHKSENVLTFPTRKNENYITLLREITDVDDYKTHLAILMITIDESILQDYFDSVSKPYDSQFCIIDGEGNYIASPKEYGDIFKQYFESNLLKDEQKDYSTMKYADIEMIVVKQELGINDWYLVGVFPLGQYNMSDYYKSISILIIFLNLIFFFTCTIVLTNMIFDPLNKVQKHMAVISTGALVTLLVEEDNDNEINQLKKSFNKMIVAIKELIEKVKEEENIIAKNELNILQAQINPHFLYNTLDAVSALALLEDHDNCFKMTQALGTFYRNSLNNGSDFITVKDEIECIKSYMTILNIRYEGKISVSYDIEEELKNYKIVKLILQPVIENAVHHGIRPKGKEGHITIRGYREKDNIYFIVTDNGVGMPQERIEEVLQGKAKREKGGFGIYNLLPRISLYYKIDHPVAITSEMGSGTEMVIYIKVLREGDR